jgi:hypothetical protein
MVTERTAWRKPMADIAGDKSKQPEGCDENTCCPNMKCTYEGMDGERYRCAVCGASFFLDYEEMK